MGTSQSYGGPGDRPALLPSWALPPQPVIPTPSVPAETSPESPQPLPEPTNSPIDSPTSPSNPTQPVVPRSPQKTARPWQAAKSSLTRFASGGGGRSGFGKAARSYVKAKGGARSATASATSGRRALGSAGQFLSTVARSGWTNALESIGLRSVVGRSADVMFTAIVNAVAPEGATLEDAVARRAMCEVFDDLFEKKVTTSNNTESLSEMSPDDVLGATTDFVCLYVYYKWIEELGRSIERGAVTAQDATKLEREVKQFVRDVVKLKSDAVDLLTLKWGDEPGQQFIDDVFQQAYSLLEDVQ